MDQKLFADIIKEVLVRDNIACLPGLGAFVTREVPAFFSHKGFVINPPYLKLDFDPQIKDNTALVEFYSESNNISLSRAKAIVGEYVQGLASEMYAARFVELPGLGRLRVTRSNDVFFVADEELSIFPHYDCLEPVSLRYLPVSEPVVVPEKPVTVPEAPVAEPEVAPVPESVVEAEAQEEVTAEAQSESAETHDEPAAEPAQEPVAAPSPEPEAAPEPESPEVQVPQGETLAEPEETIVPVETAAVPDEPAVEPAQAPEAVPVAVPSPEPEAAPEQGPEPAPAPAPKPGLSGFGIFCIVVLVLALLFFVALAVLGRTCPELVDPYLYTPEELKILNTRL